MTLSGSPPNRAMLSCTHSSAASWSRILRFAGDSGSDLIVRWTDGEVTLYPSVAEEGFHGEVRLHKPEPDETWKHATAMTVGRFGGNGKVDDLVVRWTDGEMTIYQNTGTTLGRQIIAVTPKPPQAETWKHAVEIGSGDYTGNDGWDLVVCWSDGELSLYTDGDEKGLGKDNPLVTPKK
ncbi:hypothetical protein [Streptomyces sp. HUAS TT7]|uniref:hypothetical protein n=1 Tax=Streptomyces sp. HUAS TT7 TaxID=3447507 RepID=UPI003F654BF4